MKWLYLLFFLLLVATGLFFWEQPLPSGAVTSSLAEEGTISLFFCPGEECEQALLAEMKNARESIHCAFFELDLPLLQQALREQEKMMEVQMVTDNDYLDEFPEPFVRADSWGLMHNKFCIIDGATVTTGSMNPTNNDAHRNNNNFLIIRSPYLAGVYELEFQELWNGTFKKGTSTPDQPLRLGNSTLSAFFCPEDACAEKVKGELEKARSEIRFMTFSFTHQGIADELLLKHLEGISVQGVMEARQVTKDSAFQQLNYSGIPVRKDGNPGMMHHKVFIIDGETVVTGSFNPTNGGNKRNDENLLIIHDAAIAQRFLEEFDRVWEAALSYRSSLP